MRNVLWTGQDRCYTSEGQEIPCAGSGQDGEYMTGLAWPRHRFVVHGETIRDHLTGLSWTRNANLNTFPCTWNEALDAVADLNRQRYGGHDDWRLPNRNELRSLVSYQARKPALPPDLGAVDIFLGWYWTSTTAAIHPAYAWSVHMEGARMFYGHKEDGRLFWPVRGTSPVLPVTGQKQCFDHRGRPIPCQGTGQDGELRRGVPWPVPRFIRQGPVVEDRLTGLLWHDPGATGPEEMTWARALDTVAALNRTAPWQGRTWRLPTINELASLIDCSRHSPALSPEHPFTGLGDGFWSSTTSFFETDWAWVLYLDKGACGVGYKPDALFHVWPVLS